MAAQEKQKEIYDRKHCTNPEVYALVLKKDFTRKKRKGGKLDSKWTGPLRIAMALGKGLYSLESFDEPMAFVKVANDGSTKVVKIYQTPFSTQITSRDGFVATALIDYNSEE